MDKQTIKYYSNNHSEITERYNSVSEGISKYFLSSFIPESKVIDIGCGSGRDIKILQKMGYDSYGIDPCKEFVNTIKNENTEDKNKVFLDSLPELKSIDDNSFDGILCSAVIMHLPDEQLFDASFTIRRILKENGRLLVSVPLPDKTINPTTKRDNKDRLFNGITPENLQLVFERIGFKIINNWIDEDTDDEDDFDFLF